MLFPLHYAPPGYWPSKNSISFSSLADQMKKKIDMLPRPSGTTYGGLALKETFRILFNVHGNLNLKCKLGKWNHFLFELCSREAKRLSKCHLPVRWELQGWCCGCGRKLSQKWNLVKQVAIDRILHLKTNSMWIMWIHPDSLILGTQNHMNMNWIS